MNLHSEGYDNSVERNYFITNSFGKRYSGVVHYVDYVDKTIENKTGLFVEYIRRGDFKKH